MIKIKQIAPNVDGVFVMVDEAKIGSLAPSKCQGVACTWVKFTDGAPSTTYAETAEQIAAMIRLITSQTAKARYAITVEYRNAQYDKGLSEFPHEEFPSYAALNEYGEPAIFY
jgi:hypothetical protein